MFTSSFIAESNVERAEVGVQSCILDRQHIGVCAGLIVVGVPVARGCHEGCTGPIGARSMPNSVFCTTNGAIAWFSFGTVQGSWIGSF